MVHGYQFMDLVGSALFALRALQEASPASLHSRGDWCGLMEYLTGWYLETFKHLKWWDYGDAFLSVNGRICFLSVTCFGLCALAIIYYLYPLLTRVYNYLKLRPKKFSALP